jgi:acyl dehydratase
MATATVGVSSTFLSDVPPDHVALAAWNAENRSCEDSGIGHRIRSLRRTITEGESHLFNPLMLDSHHDVQDEMSAAKEGVIKSVLIGDTIPTLRTNLTKQSKYPTMGLLVLWCEQLLTRRRRSDAPLRANAA